MRVLGVDCGTERTGYGVIVSDGRTHRLIAAGVLKTSPKWPLAQRLHEIGSGLRGLIAEHKPEMVAVEDVFYAANVKSTVKLSHVRGVVLFMAAEAKLLVGEYTPLEVKASVVGYGRAEKKQVQLMIQSLLGLDAIIASEDASDALAVAICHANRESTRLRVEGSR